MIEIEKTNPELGLKVKEHLKSKGLLNIESENEFSHEAKLNILEDKFRDLIKVLGLTLDDGNL